MIQIQHLEEYSLSDFFSSTHLESSESNPIEILVSSDRDTEYLDGIDIDKSELRYLFALFQGKLAQLEDKDKYIQSFKQNFSFFTDVVESLHDVHKNENFVYPTVLLCSREIHYVPWELLSPPIIRTFSKQIFCQSIMDNMKPEIVEKVKPRENYTRSLFTFVPFNNALDSKEERFKRKEKIEGNVLSSFYYRLKPMYDGQCKSIFPFHSNANKKKLGTKTKYVHIVDTAELDDIGDIYYILKTIRNPILVFTYLDLLELSEVVRKLKNDPIPIIFVPRSHIRQVLSKLASVQVKGEKGKVSVHNKYLLLMEKIFQIQKVEKIPIAVFNPPT